VIRLAIRVQRSASELVLAELLELAPSGVEEVDLGDLVEYAVYGPPGELPALPDVRAAAGGALIDVRTTEVPDDWSERWREFHTPLVLAGALTVRPPWEPPGSTPVDLVIDPGQAFGTGAHATTRLCLELMLQLEPEGGFLDLGCGSGVLAVAAARLGWAPVVAVDNDPASVEAAALNARVNGAVVEVARADLRHDRLPFAPTVVANLVASLLHSWVAGMRPADPLPERVIASGLLVHEVDEVAAAFAARGLEEVERRVSGDWAALALAQATPNSDLRGAPFERTWVSN
jgi:ribosomal protein L11 methyltransferase